jgi:hypothetical protein
MNITDTTVSADMYTTAQGFAKMSKPSNQLETKKDQVEKENDDASFDTEDEEKETSNTSQSIGPMKTFDQVQPKKNLQEDETEVQEEGDPNAQNSTESSEEEELVESDPLFHAKKI